MNSEQILNDEGIYFRNDVIDEISCSIGYIKKFKWSWFATQLNTFIIIGETTSIIDRQAIENFSAACYKYSLKNNRGWPRGLQAGVGSIAILAGEKIDSSAIDYCEKISKKHWSAFEIPVVFKTPEKETHRFTKNPIWGRLFFPYFASIIDRITKKF